MSMIDDILSRFRPRILGTNFQTESNYYTCKQAIEYLLDIVADTVYAEARNEPIRQAEVAGYIDLLVRTGVVPPEWGESSKKYLRENDYAGLIGNCHAAVVYIAVFCCGYPPESFRRTISRMTGEEWKKRFTEAMR